MRRVLAHGELTISTPTPLFPFTLIEGYPTVKVIVENGDLTNTVALDVEPSEFGVVPDITWHYRAKAPPSEEASVLITYPNQHPYIQAIATPLTGSASIRWRLVVGTAFTGRS